MSAGAAMEKWGDWIRMGLTIAAFLAFQMLDNRYVSRAAYERDSGVVTKSLETVRTSLALQDQQLKTLGDHETRLRAVEVLAARGGAGRTGF